VDVEAGIAQWRAHLAARRAISEADVAELEAHLRDELERLQASGLTGDEALLVAVGRLGAIDDLSREYAREHSDRLWKQLVLGARPAPGGSLAVALSCGLGAAVAVKLPALLGASLADGGYLRNLPLLVLPFLALYFLLARRARPATVIIAAATVGVVAVLLNVYPFQARADTQLLAMLGAAVVLWLVAAFAYARGDWRSHRARMDVVRFTGEWVVYYALIALGGAVLVALGLGVFAAIGIDAAPVLQQWVVPCGAAGAVLVAAWLVEAKQQVVENIAPVLTMLFTPLFTLLLVVFVVVGVAHGGLVDTQRDLLIIFDLVLVVVVGLLLYALSARDRDAAPGWFERMQLLLIVAALAVDLLVLVAMVGRIGQFGASANKLASLGLNLILLVNLVGAGWLHARFVLGRARFAAVERWQTGFVPVYLAWAVVLLAVLPPVFRFA